MFIVYRNYEIKFLYKNIFLPDSSRLLLFLAQILDHPLEMAVGWSAYLLTQLTCL